MWRIGIGLSFKLYAKRITELCKVSMVIHMYFCKEGNINYSNVVLVKKFNIRKKLKNIYERVEKI